MTQPTFQAPRFEKPAPPPPPPLQTRQPSGLPSWPLGLLAGVEGSGKSIKLAEASASEMIHRTFWIGCGEDDPDEYGAFPGARFEIVLHDGTYRGVLAAIEAAAAQEPGPDGLPNLIGFDSGSRFWHQLAGDMQVNANERQAKREAKFGNKDYALPEDGVSITMDLWNTAKDRWGHVLDALRSHNGPVLITSRLDLVTVVDGNGNPTKEKQWKVQAEKNLPYEVGFVIQMRGSYPERDDYLTKVKSLRYQHKISRGKVVAAPLGDDWTVESIWKKLGLDELVGERVHAHVVQRGDESEAEARAVLLESVRLAAEAAGVSPAAVAQAWAAAHNGQHIKDASDFDALEAMRASLVERAGERALAPAQDAQTDARGEQHPQGPQDPAVGITADETPAVTEPARTEAPPAENYLSAFDKQIKMVVDELAYQAEVLGQAYDAYVAPVLDNAGVLVHVKAQQMAVSRRGAVIDALHAAGRATEGAAYADVAGAPFLVIANVANAAQTTDRQPEDANA